MASVRITDDGIVVTFGDADISMDGDPVQQDDAKIERAFSEAVKELGVTPEQVDAVTNAQPWVARSCRTTREHELVQLFAWKPGVDAANWRSRVS